MKPNFFLVFFLLLTSWARADEQVFLIAPEDVDSFSYQERSIASFLVTIDGDLTAKMLISASLELKLAAEVEASAPWTEIQVAAWTEGAPVVPTGKFRPVSKVFAGSDSETIAIDVTDILQPLFDEGGAHNLRLALGRLSEWDEDANVGIPNALEPAEDVWARLSVVVR